VEAALSRRQALLRSKGARLGTWRQSRRPFLFLDNQISFLTAFLGSGQKAKDNMTAKSYTHLDIRQREKIEEGLNAKKSLSSIAKEIGVTPSTVIREIVRNRRDDGYSTSVWRANNSCVHRYDCKLKGVCGVRGCKRKCSVCQSHKCKKYCKDYSEHICARIAGAPYVCNGCASSSCTLHRYRYSALSAHKVAVTRAIESREGLDVTKEEMEAAAGLLKPLLANKQGLNHIYATHKDDLPFSLRSCYRHIHNGDIAIIPANLPKQTKYKKRSSGKKERKDNLSAEALEGRRYADFLALDEAERTRVVEMDCVVGPAGSTDAVLTLHFKALHFQIGIKLAVHDSKHVVDALNWLDDIAKGRFSEIFGLILCDRGSEFADAKGMECGNDGKQRCSVYYCDARQSQQKGSCEKNHVEFRKIVPKGTSLEDIGPWELAEIFSHVNSERRVSIFGKCPLEMACAVLPDYLIEELGYHLIEADEVMLKPELLEVIRQPKERNGADTC
jgi:IS30 family transposase